MNFELSEEQQEVQALARKILQDYCSNEQLRQFDQGERFDEALWQELATAGLLGLAVEERYGGMGFDFESLCLLIEEAGRHVAPLPLLQSLVIAAGAVQLYGSESLKQHILPGLVSGELLLSAGLSEANNYSVQASSMNARQDGEDWVLTGEKQYVAMANRAQFIVLSAATPSGQALLLVPRPSQGMTLLEQISTAGENQFCVQCEQVRLSAGNVLALGEQADIALAQLERMAMAASCAQMLGACDAMMRMTASYTSEREQFGVKIATFQAVGQRAADCYIDVECLRQVSQQAIYAVEHQSAEQAAEAVLIAKIWAGDVGHRVSHAAQQLHGGMGVDRDYALWRYCLWAKQLELYLGSSAQLSERLGEKIAAEFMAAV